MRIKLHTAEQGRNNQNHVVEQEIEFLSKCWKLWMQKKNIYSRLWDYGLVYEGKLLTRMSHGALQTKSPEHPRMTQNTQNLPEINLSLVICNLTNLYTRVHPKFVVLWHSLVSQSRPFTELPGMTWNLKF
jgi:hypothetical protein